MSMHYQPGSTYEVAYDCAMCNAPYKAVVDETGYLNQPRGFWASHDQIDLFLAGDSVLQGLGVPSVMELLRDQLPITMWSLSIAGYGPRQKVSALIAYALPKRPQWLIVEFYAGNDVADAIWSDVCEGMHTFLCMWSIPERRHRLSRHPIYSWLFDQSANISETFRYYAAQNFTLTTTRYLIETLKGTIKHGLIAGPAGDVPRSEAASKGFHPAQPAFPLATEGIGIPPGKALEFVTVGTAVAYRSYEHLVATLAQLEHPPTVVLLYNPSPYELYRDILMDRNAAFDQVTVSQLEAQRSFAQQHGWRFLDLTVPLRQELQVSRAWLYGRYDQSHWSPQGTAIVAAVLRDALLAVIRQ
jgi:hypothetical protein